MSGPARVRATSSRSKKGDFLLTVDPHGAAAAELRVVIEAKDRRKSWREMRDELREAKRNRGAAVALAIFTPEHAPAGIAPFDMRAGHVFAVIDPAEPETATLEAAVRLARLLAWRRFPESGPGSTSVRSRRLAEPASRVAASHARPEGPARHIGRRR